MTEILSVVLFLNLTALIASLLSDANLSESTFERFIGYLTPRRVISATIILWIVFLLPWRMLFATPEAAGQFGDMFGALTSLYSGLAFAGIVITLWMQREELTLQRNELQQTRAVFNAQKIEMTYLGMLEVLRNQIASVEATKTTIVRFAIGR